MLTIGVFGAGHLGKIHLQCIDAIDDLQLAGYYDPDDAVAEKLEGIYRFESPVALVAAVDIVDIVSPTLTHFKLAQLALQQGKHVFIEKPVTHTAEEALQLIELCETKGLKVQVGHVERFNPAMLALRERTIQPMFIEAHRLALFNPRGTDVSVILDLMIHDLDIVLSLVDAEVTAVSASGVAVVSDTPDIANARIEFDNGCVANFTASRISVKQMRKLRLFQPDAYISLDFLKRQAEIIRIYDADDPNAPPAEEAMELETKTGRKLLQMQVADSKDSNAIRMELEAFVRCIEEDKEPVVSLQEGYKAIALAHRIIKEIEMRAQRYQNRNHDE